MSPEVPQHSTVFILTGPCKEMTAQHIQDGSCCPIESLKQTLNYNIWKKIFGPYIWPRIEKHCGRDIHISTN